MAELHIRIASGRSKQICMHALTQSLTHSLTHTHTHTHTNHTHTHAGNLINQDTFTTLLTDAAKYNESSRLQGRIVAKSKTLCQGSPGL